MSDLDLKTALSVFGKMPQEKIARVLEAAVEVASDKITGKDLPTALKGTGLNDFEVQLGLVAANHYTAFLRELGPEHVNSIRHFVKMLLTKTVDQDKIVSALRGVGLSEDQIRSALSLMKIWAPGRILIVSKGRGMDEFSVKMRELFDLYLQGFLLKEPVGRVALVRMTLEPEKDRPLKFLLGEIPNLDTAVQNARPFWWSADHERMLTEALLRRIPVLILGPLATLADKWPEPAPPDVLSAHLAESKLPPFLGELYPFITGTPVLPESPPTWEGLTTDDVADDPKGFYLRLITYWTYFQFFGKGSPGWKKTTDSVEDLLSRIHRLFIKAGRLDLQGIHTDIQEPVLGALATAATFPVPAAVLLRRDLLLDSPANTSTLAKRFRLMK